MSPERGRQKLEWAMRFMPVLTLLGQEIRDKGNLKGERISMALHTEAKTGVLALTLAKAGAHVRLSSCNPLSTDDDIPAALSSFPTGKGKLEVRAKRGQTREEYYDALNWTLDQLPSVIIDDGGDLARIVHSERQDLLKGLRGGCEETTTGVNRLRALHEQGLLKIPMIDINDCMMKHLFDNRYGTGQSTLDGVLSATNRSIASMNCVVAGYGWCGKGISLRLKAMGANVTVTEVDPVKAVEAAMDGHRVRTMADAASEADLIVTATGCRDVIHRDIVDLLKDGCMLANAGHFDNEIDVGYLREHSPFQARTNVEGFSFGDRNVFLLAEGRLVNLVAGQGHPVEIMDLSFSLQAAGAEHLLTNDLPVGVYPLPEEIDRKVAVIKLQALRAGLDVLTEGQKRYLSSWDEGT
jgi:adenosylhomocysteinase